MSQHLHSDFKIRIPDELKDKIRRSADELNRSMTADIVARLEESFEKPKNLTDIERENYETLKQDMKFMSEELSALIKQVTEHQNSKY